MEDIEKVSFNFACFLQFLRVDGAPPPFLSLSLSHTHTPLSPHLCLQELPQLVNRLLQSPAALQRQLIEQYYTPNCRLTHPLVIANNREEIIKVFQYWTQFATAHLEAEFEDIIYSADHNKCAYFFTQKIAKFQHLPISFNLPIASLLYFTQEKEEQHIGTTKWKIPKQIDLHSFEGILYNAPLLGPILEVAV